MGILSTSAPPSASAPMPDCTLALESVSGSAGGETKNENPQLVKCSGNWDTLWTDDDEMPHVGDVKCRPGTHLKPKHETINYSILSDAGASAILRQDTCCEPNVCTSLAASDEVLGYVLPVGCVANADTGEFTCSTPPRCAEGWGGTAKMRCNSDGEVVSLVGCTREGGEGTTDTDSAGTTDTDAGEGGEGGAREFLDDCGLTCRMVIGLLALVRAFWRWSLLEGFGPDWTCPSTPCRSGALWNATVVTSGVHWDRVINWPFMNIFAIFQPDDPAGSGAAGWGARGGATQKQISNRTLTGKYYIPDEWGLARIVVLILDIIFLLLVAKIFFEAVDYFDWNARDEEEADSDDDNKVDTAAASPAAGAPASSFEPTCEDTGEC